MSYRSRIAALMLLVTMGSSVAAHAERRGDRPATEFTPADLADLIGGGNLQVRISFFAANQSVVGLAGPASRSYNPSEVGFYGRVPLSLATGLGETGMSTTPRVHGQLSYVLRVTLDDPVVGIGATSSTDLRGKVTELELVVPQVSWTRISEAKMLFMDEVVVESQEELAEMELFSETILASSWQRAAEKVTCDRFTLRCVAVEPRLEQEL